LTPDSFYSGSRADNGAALARAEQMLADGAQVVDIGAESTRPGAIAVSAAEQIERLTAFTNNFSRVFGKAALRRISIDTQDVRVMRHLIDCGVGVINDVSGGSTEIYRLIAEADVEYVLMHTQGPPQTMQIAPHYEDVVAEVRTYLEVHTAAMVEHGVNPHKILWDPGIGFGKTVEHNLALIAESHKFRASAQRLLMGVSRKSFIGKILDRADAADRLNGTLAVQLYLTLRGCDILRVHDVQEMAECLKMLAAISRFE